MLEKHGSRLPSFAVGCIASALAVGGWWTWTHSSETGWDPLRIVSMVLFVLAALGAMFTVHLWSEASHARRVVTFAIARWPGITVSSEGIVHGRVSYW